MATWTNWAWFHQVLHLNDGSTLWNDHNDLEETTKGDASWNGNSNVGTFNNRLSFRVREAMFDDAPAGGFTEYHRLRNMEFRWEHRQGSLLIQTAPYDVHCYWAGASRSIRTPPLIWTGWPGTVETVSLTLAQWGFDTEADGTNAMRQFLDNTVNVILVVKTARSVAGYPTGWVQDAQVRLEYDDPLPRNFGAMIGAL